MRKPGPQGLDPRPVPPSNPVMSCNGVHRTMCTLHATPGTQHHPRLRLCWVQLSARWQRRYCRRTASPAGMPAVQPISGGASQPSPPHILPTGWQGRCMQQRMTCCAGNWATGGNLRGNLRNLELPAHLLAQLPNQMGVIWGREALPAWHSMGSREGPLVGSRVPPVMVALAGQQGWRCGASKPRRMHSRWGGSCADPRAVAVVVMCERSTT